MFTVLKFLPQSCKFIVIEGAVSFMIFFLALMASCNISVVLEMCRPSASRTVVTQQFSIERRQDDDLCVKPLAQVCCGF